MFTRHLLHAVQLLLVALACHQAIADQPQTVTTRAQVYSIGVAKVDITPDYPVRMNGFLVRKEESVGVRQPIWAKALAVGQGQDAAVVITLDGLGIPAEITEKVGQQLKEKAGLDPARLSITASHTHTGPMINGCAPNIFGEPIPADAQAHIDRYTQEFTDKLVQVGVVALADRRDSTMHWGIGQAKFAKNRRDKNGPFDHDLPMLVVRDLNNKVRMIYVSYACHCVTLSEPKIGGDWAGYAQVQIEKRYPGVIAMTSVGCAGDQNPSGGVMNDRFDVAEQQGEEIAAEVERLIKQQLRPVAGELHIANKPIQLPLDKLPSREEFATKAKENTPPGYFAKVQLAKLDRGEKLREQIDYRIQTWSFGDSLALVFLPGEVVSEYGLRLKSELDGRRVWVNAYANACPCYIPSEKVLKAGGYEGGGAMIYYDQPTKFAPGLEQKIVDVVLEQLRERFPSQIEAGKGQGSRPLAPEQSLSHMRTRSELAIDLVAAEPLVTSPVAVDFGPDGKVYVAEMFDYPAGEDGTYGPAGRVRVLSSSQGNENLDTSTIFIDGIPFPTGVTVWRKGVLIAAAPDILYAEDTTGDGRADVVRKLYSGFGVDNFQARVNSLEVGLDGWVYGSCGLFGGSIKTFASDTPYQLGDRDFRIQPDTGAIEPAIGRTQQGRVRDDFDNWFGCDNSDLGRHYPLATHYIERNKFAPPPPVSSHVPVDGKLVPGNDALQLFKLSGGSGVATAACGIGIYRDELLGPSVKGNLFTCEPVNLIVHRVQLTPKDSTFEGHVASDEPSEFVSSSDTWFRPVQARTAPDGSLWILDMYRYVIEHPRWIPAESLDKIDPRAGANMGRIYRVRPRGEFKTAWPRLDKLNTVQLVSALDSANGWQRDMAMQLLVWYRESDHAAAGPALKQLLRTSSRPETRVQVLATLAQRGELVQDDCVVGLADAHPAVRRHAIRLSEGFVKSAQSDELLSKVSKLAVTDKDGQVRLQAACSLGAWPQAAAAEALAQLALASPGDRFLRSAVVSSLSPANIEAFVTTLLKDQSSALSQLAPSILPLAFKMLPEESSMSLLDRLAKGPWPDAQSGWVHRVVGQILDAVESRPSLAKLLLDSSTKAQLQQLVQTARQQLASGSGESSEAYRLACMALLNRANLSSNEELQADWKLLGGFLLPKNSAKVQSAALAALLRSGNRAVAQQLLTAWPELSPSLRNSAIDQLVSRPEWVVALLDSIEEKKVDVVEVDATRRQQLLSHRDSAIRSRAEKVLAGKLNQDREAVLKSYASVTELKGDAARGAELYRKNCSSCHKLNEIGSVVGPDLVALAGKPVNFFMQEILDPNRNLDSRYMAYAALTDTGRTLTGLLVAETAGAITLRGAEGKEETLERDELDQFRATRASLMPEGLEKMLPPQGMADVISFIKANAAQEAAPETMASGELARDMLTETLSMESRLALVPLTLKTAPEVITAMAANMPNDEKEEYRRIPWIWRVAVAAGKAGDEKTCKKVMEIAMPREGTQLRDWQAVVIGGGVINGLGLRGDWPAARIAPMLASDAKLNQKWQALITASKAMAENEKVKTGTRYDALRIVALEPWPAPKDQLLKYLPKGGNAELQMGSVSGLADVDHPEATALLVDHLDHYDKENRRLAVVALSRGVVRQRILIELLAAGKVKSSEIAESERKLLLESSDKQVAEKAANLIK